MRSRSRVIGRHRGLRDKGNRQHEEVAQRVPGGSGRSSVYVEELRESARGQKRSRRVSTGLFGDRAVVIDMGMAMLLVEEGLWAAQNEALTVRSHFRVRSAMTPVGGNKPRGSFPGLRASRLFGAGTSVVARRESCSLPCCVLSGFLWCGQKDGSHSVV